MRIAHLSDLHLTGDGEPLYGLVATWGALTQGLARVARLQPDLVLMTGDLVQGGDPRAYAGLRAALAELPVPVALLPGNHDSRAELRRAFPTQAWSAGDLCCQRLDQPDGSLLLLDVTVPGEEWGAIGAAQLDWLDAHCLPQRPALLCLHQPPFAVGIAGMDAIGCRHGALLAQWLAGRPQVEALLCGHVHRQVSTTFAGRPARTAPSVAHQIALQDGPLAFTLEPGGFLVHDWIPGTSLVTHSVPVAAAATHIYPD